MKKYLILLIAVAFVCWQDSAQADWQKEIQDKEKTAGIIRDLIHADKIYIHSEMISSDVDNDGDEELIVCASIINDRKDSSIPRVDEELILLLKKGLKYSIKARTEFNSASSSSNISLNDLTGNGRPEIIVSEEKIRSPYAKGQIFRFEQDKLLPIIFKGGEFNDMQRLKGMFEFKRSSGQESHDVVLRYGPCLAIADSYRWDGKNYVLYSETSRDPSINEKKLISHLNEYISEYVRDRYPQSLWSVVPRFKRFLFRHVLYDLPWGIYDIQFYHPDRLLAYATEGHVYLHVLFEYTMDGDEIRMTKLEQIEKYNPDYLRNKYGLLPEKAVNYFKTERGNYKWTPSNVFK